MGVDERTQPRISVNKLGEYISAAPARRRRIVIDQKRPRDFIVPRYGAAVEKIVAYLSRKLSERDLLQAIEDLEDDCEGTEWQAQTNQLCADAIGCFLDCLDLLEFDGISLSAPSKAQAYLKIGGITVSVRPELEMRGRLSRGATSRGFLKLYFSKTYPLDDQSGTAVATCLRQYAEEMFSTAEVDNQLCLVVDVFAGKIFAAPRAYKRRLRDIEAACEEISRAWPML